jgi:hypothetical protein
MRRPCACLPTALAWCLDLIPCMPVMFRFFLQVKDEGYEVEHNGYCVTVFSAPNYCDQLQNKGAWICFNGKDMTPQFTQFEAVEHPNVKAMAYAGNFYSQMLGM